MDEYKALVTHDSPNYKTEYTTIKDLGEGDVIVDVEYSSINFKDALAVTGKGKILKSFPLIPGIDLSGTVVESKAPSLSPGQPVLVTGCGLGENHNGGFCQRAQVPKEWVIPLPSNLSTKDVMILGTAGFTAALALWRMLQMDQSPNMGPIAITGASGGVGSWAVQIFSQHGFEVIAISSKKSKEERLKNFGASQVIHPDEWIGPNRPLESVLFGGAVDNVGGSLLSGILPRVNLWGNVASIGLADSASFSSTVMPYILRGVSILGISSGNCPHSLRQKIWGKLSSDWKPKYLEENVACEIPLSQVISKSQDLLDRKVAGRILVTLK